MWIRYGLGDSLIVLVSLMLVMWLCFCNWERMCRLM